MSNMRYSGVQIERKSIFHSYMYYSHPESKFYTII